MMRLLAVTCVPSAPLGLFLAQAVDAPWSLFAEGGAVVILGWAVWHLLAKSLPRQQKATDDAREAFERTLDRIADRYDERAKEAAQGQQRLAEAIHELHTNCIQYQAGQRAKEREDPD